MLIQSLDLGQRSGWAIGPAGSVPNSGFLLLRKKEQSITHAGYNLRCYLETVWAKRIPDLVVYEAPLSLQAWLHNAKKSGVPQNSEGLEHLIKLSHIVETTAYGWSIRCEPIHRVSVMWGLTGKASWGDYKANKKAILKSLLLQGLIPSGCTDQDLADAVAMHVIASGKFAKNKPATHGLFAKNSLDQC